MLVVASLCVGGAELFWLPISVFTELICIVENRLVHFSLHLLFVFFNLFYSIGFKAGVIFVNFWVIILNESLHDSSFHVEIFQAQEKE